MDDFEQDVLASIAYLGGFSSKDERGISRKRYYSEGSTEARFCRAALARVLSSNRPLHHQLRDMLATMFDPSPKIESPWSERKLSVGFRKKPKDHGTNTQIAWFVWERVKAGANPESAVEEAMDHFRHPSRDDMSRRRIYKLWSTYKPKFELIFGPIDRTSK